MLQLIKFIGAILLSAGLIWFGSFFEKRSLVRITSYILPVFIVLSAIISIYFILNEKLLNALHSLPEYNNGYYAIPYTGWGGQFHDFIYKC